MSLVTNLTIFFTILLAMIMELIPFPEGLPKEIGFLRPELVLMTLIYWVVALPHRAGVVLAWVSGLTMDTLVGNFLGQFACSFVIVSYVVMQFYQRLRMFSVWQQAILVSGLIILHRGLSFLHSYFFDDTIPSLWQMMPAISSALVWPLVFLLLRAIRRSLKLI